MTTGASRLARLQQVTTLAVAAAALAWLVANLARSPVQAVLGAVLIFFGFALVLGLEFLILRPASRGDPAPVPSASALLRAWWGEVRAALAVFYWRQPFRWRAEPDHLAASVAGRRGAVFIHGFVCNRGFWNPWLRRLRAMEHGFVAVNLEPVFTSIDRYVATIDDAVRRVAAATGQPPVLICHSMGGLAARAWLRAHPDGAQRVARVVTIGTPHHGTWVARFSHLPNGRQMRMAGDWLRMLAQDEAARPMPPFTCWYSNCDNIVFPPTTATLPGADNRLVPGVAHVALAFRPEVVEASVAALADR